MTRTGRIGYWAAIALAAVAVGEYHLWQLRAAGYRFDWSREQSGYYNYLGRAFAHGRLSLEIQPAPELLALPNPWDHVANERYRMHDMVLYHGRYFLYHGAGPAVMLFAPWRLITGRDLPERFALFLFCFGGFLFSCGALLRWLALAGAKPPPPLLALMLVALGVCQSVPYLLTRVWVYEVAIGAGYFCISAALFFLARGIESTRGAYWLAASGLMFGLAVSCRPHLIMAGAIAAIGLILFLVKSRNLRSALTSKEWLAFATAFALSGVAIAIYNFQRFDNPFEFGLRYILAGPYQNRLRLASANILPGLYFWLACPPDWTPVFPWARLAFRYPFNSTAWPFPPEYFMEATIGALFLAPFALAAPFVPGARRVANGAVRILLWTALASAITILLFLTATGFTTHRYEVDFLPILVLVAIANIAIHIDRTHGLTRAILLGAFIVAIACGVVISMALGIAGPYDEMLKNRPVNYLRIARWFSPIEQFRPMLNPEIDVRFTTEFAPAAHDREPLLTIGRQVYRYFLYVDYTAGKPRLISQSDTSTVTKEMDDGGPPHAEIRVAYAPESGTMTVTVNGHDVLVHQIGALVTAPAEVTVGQNRIEASVTVPLYPGRIYNILQTVRANR